MSPLRLQVLREMHLRGFAQNTITNYIHAYEQLARYYHKPLDSLKKDEVQRFLEFLITQRKLAWATINVYFSAFRFLYEKVLHRPRRLFSIPPRGRSGKRPGVLSRTETQRVIQAPKNLKHRALLSLCYGSGLRVSELVRVQVADVDRDRMMLRVEQGKGRKDRYTILSQNSLRFLERLWREYQPASYFFFGHNPLKAMCTGTARSVYYQALKKGGVRRVGGLHVLRHCFATHLLEQGVDVYMIKRFMGHTSVVTTSRYMHVSRERIASVISPLDRPS